MKKSITKDEVNLLPVEKFEGEIVVVEKIQDITAAIEEIQKENIIGIDTETKPSFKKGISFKTALIQIATRRKTFLFRINKTGLPFPLIRIFENPNIQKIGIAIHQDMKELGEQYQPFNYNNFIDLNILCKNEGFKNVGARNLSAMVLGFRISKRQQTSNWELNELSEAQISYAATDAWVCREIYLKLFHSA